MTAIFNPCKGIQYIREGEEDLFFHGMSMDVKQYFIHMNAYGIAALEAMKEIEVEYLLSVCIDGPVAALREGIERAGGVPDSAIAQTKGRFNAMNMAKKIEIFLLFK